MEKPLEDVFDELTEESLEDPWEESTEEAPQTAPAHAEITLPDVIPAEGETEAAATATADVAAAADASGKHAAAPAAGKHAPQGKHAAPVKRKKNRTGLILGIASGIMATLLIAVAGFGYAYYRGEISLMQYDDGTHIVHGSIDANEEGVIAQAEDMLEATQGLAITEPVLDDKSYSEFTGNPFDGRIVNILVLGTDERSKEFTDAARSDTMIIVSVNLETGAIKLVSIERGMGVPVLEGKYEGEWDWITHIFRYGGANLMMKTVSTVFDVDVRYYVRVNFNTFIQLIDAMGGLDIVLNQAEADYLNNNIIAYNEDLCSPLFVEPGVNHMNGWLALQYARCRKVDSDWGRVVRQRIVIKDILQQARNLPAWKYDKVLDTVLPLIKTNLTEAEITQLLLKLPLIMSTMDVEEITLPVKGTYGSMEGMGGRSLFAADFPANAKILHDMLYGDLEEE